MNKIEKFKFINSYFGIGGIESKDKKDDVIISNNTELHYLDIFDYTCFKLQIINRIKLFIKLIKIISNSTYETIEIKIRCRK